MHPLHTHSQCTSQHQDHIFFPRDSDSSSLFTLGGGASDTLLLHNSINKWHWFFSYPQCFKSYSQIKFNACDSHCPHSPLKTIIHWASETLPEYVHSQKRRSAVFVILHPKGVTTGTIHLPWHITLPIRGHMIELDRLWRQIHAINL